MKPGREGEREGGLPSREDLESVTGCHFLLLLLSLPGLSLPSPVKTSNDGTADYDDDGPDPCTPPTPKAVAVMQDLKA